MKVEGVPNDWNRKPIEIADAIAQMEEVQLQAIRDGLRDDLDCNKYFEMLNDAGKQQKEQTEVCDDNHKSALIAADDKIKDDKSKLHCSASDIAADLESCEEETDIKQSLTCLSKKHDEQSKPLSTLSRDSSKLLNSYTRDISTADNNLESCKTEVVFFYSDVIADIMDAQRRCVLFGEDEGYEIPPFQAS